MEEQLCLWGSFCPGTLLQTQQGFYLVRFEDGSCRWAAGEELVTDACLPQKPRTAEEDEVFHRGLTKMGSLYASVTGTAVVQIKSIPDRPEDFDGRIIVHGLPAEVDEASRCAFSALRCAASLSVRSSRRGGPHHLATS